MKREKQKYYKSLWKWKAKFSNQKLSHTANITDCQAIASVCHSLTLGPASLVLFSLHFLRCILCGWPVPLGYEMHNFLSCVLTYCSCEGQFSDPFHCASCILFAIFPVSVRHHSNKQPSHVVGCRRCHLPNHWENLLFDLLNTGILINSFLCDLHEETGVFCVISISCFEFFPQKCNSFWPGFISENFAILTPYLIQPCFSSAMSTFEVLG